MRKTALVLACLPIAPISLHAGSLTPCASGEGLTTAGFSAPEPPRDGWALEFARIIARFDQVAVWQSQPPFMAEGPEISGVDLCFAGAVIVDIGGADEDDRVELAMMAAVPDHYNALFWVLFSAVNGEAEGCSLVLEVGARKDGHEVACTQRSADAMMYACGEYLGDEFVTQDSPTDLEITLNLDHLFGRADTGPEDEMNLAILGFERFAAGVVQDFLVGDLHLGHVGEGRCHVLAT